MSNQSSTMFNIALIAASGVSETEMTAIQRALATKKWPAETKMQVISPETGLIHSWAENSWGHCYPADAKIEVSLGSDFDMLIIPGGERHVAKLAANPHTKRILSTMHSMQKPMAVFSDGQSLLAPNDLMGDNVQMLSYDDANGLNAAAESMLVQFENIMLEILAEEQQQAA